MEEQVSYVHSDKDSEHFGEISHIINYIEQHSSLGILSIEDLIKKIKKTQEEGYELKKEDMNIGSGSKYPAGALSNFSPHPFIIDDVKCSSMEGFLQALKFKSIEMQAEVCTLVGRAAKSKGRHKNWQRTQILYWKGEEIARNSDRYQELLDQAFLAMLEQSGSFKRALVASGNAVLTHTIGKNKINDTVLTVREFCSRLTKLREKMKEEKKGNQTKIEF